MCSRNGVLAYSVGIEPGAVPSTTEAGHGGTHLGSALRSQPEFKASFLSMVWGHYGLHEAPFQ